MRILFFIMLGLQIMKGMSQAPIADYFYNEINLNTRFTNSETLETKGGELSVDDGVYIGWDVDHFSFHINESGYIDWYGDVEPTIGYVLKYDGDKFTPQADAGGGSGTVTSVGLTTGTSGSDINISGSPITTSGTITLNIPNASSTARGVVSTGSQSFSGAKSFNDFTQFGNGIEINGDAAIDGIFTFASTSGSPLIISNSGSIVEYEGTPISDGQLLVGETGAFSLLGPGSEDDILSINASGLIEWITPTYLITEIDGSVSNELQTLTVPSMFSISGSGTTSMAISTTFLSDAGTESFSIGLNAMSGASTRSVSIGPLSGGGASFTGFHCVFLGWEAGAGATTLKQVTLIGSGAGRALTTTTGSDKNTGVGFNVLNVANGASGNTTLGWNGLLSLTTGDDNIAIGATAGGTITTGSGNIMIGNNTAASAVGANNETNINGFLFNNATGTGIGDQSPDDYFTVGSTSQLRLSSTGTITRYKDIATTNNGIPSSVASTSFSAQTAAIAATTIYTTTEDGWYELKINVVVTTAATTSSILGGCQGKYTSAIDNVVKTTTNLNNFSNSNGNTTGTTVCVSYPMYCKSGTAIQYIIGYTSSGATAMQYAGYVTCLKL